MSGSLRKRWVADAELEVILLYGSRLAPLAYPTIDAVAGILPDYDPQCLLGWNGELASPTVWRETLIGLVEFDLSKGTMV